MRETEEKSSAEIAELARARAAQEAVFKAAIAEVAGEIASKERRFQETKAQRQAEEHAILLAEQEAKIARIRDELRLEDEKRRKPQMERRVEQMFIDDTFVWTVPDLSDRLDGEWIEARVYYEEPDEIVPVDRNHLAVARGGSSLELTIRRLQRSRFFIMLEDKNEHPMTQLRLGGTLEPVEIDEEFRMAYRQHGEAPIHSSVQGLLESNLRQLLTVVKEGTVIPLKYPED